MPAGADQSKAYLRGLLDASKRHLETCLSRTTELTEALQSTGDVEEWAKVLANKEEVTIIKQAQKELQLSVFLIFSGFYRHATSSLRLALELSLAIMHLSTHLLDRMEWEAGRKDLNWTMLVDENEGVFSPRYLNCLVHHDRLRDSEHVRRIRDDAKKIYRKLSEAIHGNRLTWEIYSESFTYNKETFNELMSYCHKILDILHFILCLRYLNELEDVQKASLEAIVMSRLGHIDGIRAGFGEQSK